MHINPFTPNMHLILAKIEIKIIRDEKPKAKALLKSFHLIYHTIHVGLHPQTQKLELLTK